MKRRRELTPEQRRAKNEGDRQRRKERNVEFKRLKKAEPELQAVLEAQRNENGNLREENERLNAMLSDLMNTIHQLRDEIRQIRETQELDLLIQCDRVPSPNEDGANNEPSTEPEIMEMLDLLIQSDRVPSPNEDGANNEPFADQEILEMVNSWIRSPRPNEEGANNEPTT